MKKNNIYLIMFSAFIFISSCRTSKDIRMFQEMDDAPVPVYNVPSPPEHKIKPYDNLYISILTLDPEVNSLLNPTTKSGSNFSTGTSQMFGDPTSKYINGYVVSLDSTVSLPMIGKINLVGLNLTEAEKQVKVRAEEFLKEPEIQVKLLNYRVNVSGEVRVPGMYYNYEGSINMLDAISMAQGITEYADLRKVIVKRQNKSDYTTYEVDLTNNSIYASEVFFLQPNDLVYIPPSDLKRRTANSDTYSKLLSTVSTMLVAIALLLRN